MNKIFQKEIDAFENEFEDIELDGIKFSISSTGHIMKSFLLASIKRASQAVVEEAKNIEKDIPYGKYVSNEEQVYWEGWNAHRSATLAKMKEIINQ